MESIRVIPIIEWKKKLDNGDFVGSDVETCRRAGFDMWYCEDQYLYVVKDRLIEAVLQILESPKIDINTQGLVMSNEFLKDRSLRSSFRIVELTSREVCYTVYPRESDNPDGIISSVWGRENDFESALATGPWKDVLKFFGTLKSSG